MNLLPVSISLPPRFFLSLLIYFCLSLGLLWGGFFSSFTKRKAISPQVFQHLDDGHRVRILKAVESAL